MKEVEKKLNISINIEVPGFESQPDSISTSDNSDELEMVYYFTDRGGATFYYNNLMRKEVYSYNVKGRELHMTPKYEAKLRYEIQKLTSDSLVFKGPIDAEFSQQEVTCIRILDIFTTRQINEKSKSLSIQKVAQVIFNALKENNYDLIDRINTNPDLKFREEHKTSFVHLMQEGTSKGIVWGKIALEDTKFDDGVSFSDSATQLEKFIQSQREPSGYWVELIISQGQKKVYIDCSYIANTDWGWSFNGEFLFKQRP